MSVTVGIVTKVLPLDGYRTPITVQLAPLSAEMETVMFDFAVPPNVRARKSTVRLVKPAVENAGETICAPMLVIWT